MNTTVVPAQFQRGHNWYQKDRSSLAINKYYMYQFKQKLQYTDSVSHYLLSCANNPRDMNLLLIHLSLCYKF